MKKSLHLLILLFICSSYKNIINDKFPLFEEAITINEARQFEKSLKSEELKIETKIYSSETKPEDFKNVPQPLIFKRTNELSIPIFVNYFFRASDSMVYEIDFDWMNLTTLIELTANKDTIDLNDLPSKELYQSEFKRVSLILDENYRNNDQVPFIEGTRNWSYGKTQFTLCLKGKYRETNFLRLKIKYN